jgi:hypothetical protein
MSAKGNEAVVRRVVEAIWNRSRLDVADELFTADYRNHDGLIPDLVRGPEAIKFSVVLYRLAFPDLHITIEELRSKGATVVLHWSAGTRSLARPGETGRAEHHRLLAGITRSRLVGGKIVESWTRWGTSSLRRDDETS